MSKTRNLENNFVSIIIPTRNADKYLDKVLTSIDNQTFKSLETIIVDCNSTDKTLDIAKTHNVKIINFSPKGDYRSGQKNLGAKNSKGDYVFFLDSDAELSHNIVKECVELGSLGIDAVYIPEKHIGTGFWTRAKALERECYLGDDNVEAPWFFRKKPFLELGGYDENLVSGEDWDLSYRFRKAGYKFGRNKSFIHHNLGRYTPWLAFKKKFYYGQKLSSYLSKKNNNVLQQVPIFRASLFRNSCKLILHPVLTLGFLFLKFLESVAVLLGIIYARYFKKDIR